MARMATTLTEGDAERVAEILRRLDETLQGNKRDIFERWQEWERHFQEFADKLPGFLRAEMNERHRFTEVYKDILGKVDLADRNIRDEQWLRFLGQLAWLKTTRVFDNMFTGAIANLIKRIWGDHLTRYSNFVNRLKDTITTWKFNKKDYMNLRKEYKKKAKELKDYNPESLDASDSLGRKAVEQAIEAMQNIIKEIKVLLDKPNVEDADIAVMQARVLRMIGLFKAVIDNMPHSNVYLAGLVEDVVKLHEETQARISSIERTYMFGNLLYGLYKVLDRIAEMGRDFESIVNKYDALFKAKAEVELKYAHTKINLREYIDKIYGSLRDLLDRILGTEAEAPNMNEIFLGIANIIELLNKNIAFLEKTAQTDPILQEALVDFSDRLKKKRDAIGTILDNMKRGEMGDIESATEERKPAEEVRSISGEIPESAPPAEQPSQIQSTPESPIVPPSIEETTTEATEAQEEIPVHPSSPGSDSAMYPPSGSSGEPPQEATEPRTPSEPVRRSKAWIKEAKVFVKQLSKVNLTEMWTITFLQNLSVISSDLDDAIMRIQDDFDVRYLKEIKERFEELRTIAVSSAGTEEKETLREYVRDSISNLQEEIKKNEKKGLFANLFGRRNRQTESM